MPGPAIIVAAVVTAFVLTTDEPLKFLMSPEAKAVCAETRCFVVTKDQLEQIFREGMDYGTKQTIERMQPSCLKDET